MWAGVFARLLACLDSTTRPSRPPDLCLPRAVLLPSFSPLLRHSTPLSSCSTERACNPPSSLRQPSDFTLRVWWGCGWA
eukprot:4704977-Pleurochrysis_carterae.AAC.3